ncbi:MAG TPA: FG-GAP-like repeat-containing protein, partial [Gaiellaceae bacterium]|nr:FG-GAP-like repeat-containing protein [Gaiellaceae bacterium]
MSRAMAVHAAPAPGTPSLRIRGASYPILLPKLRDPRLHLAATITSLQVIGQIGFHFRISIPQILVSIGACAVLEIAIAFRTQRVLLWPASAMLTGNGVAFVLRLPGMQHGDWWSTREWWLYAATGAGSLLSKHVLKWRGEHVFNPSNIGLVVVFLALGRGRVEPLDFWWGPMSWWLALALVVIVTGGFAILRRLKLLRVALSFWFAFAVGIGGLALAGHAMVARWHLGPIEGLSFWWVLVTSPEVLVFLFFMITDPKTAPRDPRGRIVYGLALGLLSALLIAPTTTEFAAKVALLSTLAIVCLAMTALRELPTLSPRAVGAVAAAGLAAYAGVAVFANSGAPAVAAQTLASAKLPPISILPSPGVQTQLTRPTAETIAATLLAVRPAAGAGPLRIHLVQGTDQGPPVAVVQAGSVSYRLEVDTAGVWSLEAAPAGVVAATAPTSDALAGLHLRNVASAVGLDFRQDSFRYGISLDTKAMMGGGVCWLDYNGDGWLDLFAVNSYASTDAARFEASGGLPTSALYENVHGRFRNVTRGSGAGLAVQGDGCAAGDLDGDGRPDLVVTTASGVDLLWNRGGGRFAHASLPAHGWYTGTAIADVNGDGRPDVFVAGYADPNEPIPGSLAGFPTNYAGVRDLLFLNEGGRRFREVGVEAGLESAALRHGLGAAFTDANGDGRPDLYVANDEDPNELYVNVPWPGGAQADPAGLGFRFEERAADAGVADPFAGMGVATADGHLFVTNSRGEPPAAYAKQGARFANERPGVDPAVGQASAGWGDSWVDLANSGSLDLVLADGGIPVTGLARDAQPLRVLAPAQGGFGDASAVLGAGGVSVNGRGLAAADADNDGRMEIAVNTIGGKLVLLRPSGATGHWLDVSLSRFSPGAVVTAVLPDGRRLSREVQAGSSYLSSEDPRVHFGLGAATTVRELLVRFPGGATTELRRVRGDRIVHVAVPPARSVAASAAAAPQIASCTPAGSRSVARTWTAAAVRVLRLGEASQPVQARDLYDLAAAMQHAYAVETSPAGRDEAISFAAYRLLLSDASYDSNLAQSFAVLTRQLRALCYSERFASTRGTTPAAAGNRVALAAIAAGKKDGSNERLHYADPSYRPLNEPLVVAQAVSTPHDATFWQPLALAQVSPRGSGAVPAKVQVFAGSQWGHVRTFALGRVPDPGKPPLGDPDGSRYRAAALDAIRATAGAAHAPVDASPLAWEQRALALPRASLARDLRVELALGGALNDAAVAAWGAKRAYQGPRPISMIRYLAFNHELPAVAGLTKQDGSRTLVRLAGRWVDGARWTPPAA